MKQNPGILSIFNNIAPGREADFEEWFQHEHLAERLAVPGFLLARRYEAVSADRRFFNFYVTESPDVLRSEAYLARVNDPTPMTGKIMSEVFRDMVRNVSEQMFARGNLHGSHAVTVRFAGLPDTARLLDFIGEHEGDTAFARGEIWQAKDFSLGSSAEETLRGGDGRFAACLLVETLRGGGAEKIADALKRNFPQAATGVYRLLCEIRREAKG